ncbi:hypothetical protein D3C78_1863380 [compost metagenome]
MSENLYRTSRHIFIDLAVWARAYGANDLDTEFVTQLKSLIERDFLIRIEEDLHDAFTVTHINENQTA